MQKLLFLKIAIFVLSANTQNIMYNKTLCNPKFNISVAFEIAQSKGNFPRSIDPDAVPFIKGEIYQKEGFSSIKIAEQNEPFIISDVRGQTQFVFPVQYNPVTKTLRIYSEITFSTEQTNLRKNIVDFSILLGIISSIIGIISSWRKKRKKNSNNKKQTITNSQPQKTKGEINIDNSRTINIINTNIYNIINYQN